MVFLKTYNTLNLWSKFKSLPEEAKRNVQLINSLRHYDHTVNILWVMAHYNAAAKYLGGGEIEVEATGGSSWRTYLHPKYQRRIFFPDLWKKEELENWGVDNLEGHKILPRTQ